MSAPRYARKYALAGVVLALGAPGGWLLLRVLFGTATFQAMGAEVWAHGALYLYLTCATVAAFSGFGALAGLRADRLAKQTRELTELSMTDALTGLKNRRYFFQRLDAECSRADREAMPLGLILVDLDHFKRINDSHGHPFGDVALQHAAKRILAGARSFDVPCRIGGEEFAVLCPGTTLADAVGVAERIRQSLEQTQVDDGEVQEPLTASFGVAVRRPRVPVDAALRAADEALYRAKQGGRNRVEAAPSIHPLVRSP